MAVDTKTKYGKIATSLDALATVVQDSVSNVFGVVGLGSKKSLLSDQINVLLKKEKSKDGVIVRKEKGDAYSIDVFVILAYGVKISEVVSEIQTQISYQLSKTFDIQIAKVDVYVQEIRKL